MTDPLTPVQVEYRRRRSRVLGVVILFVLVPFVLEAILSYVSAPPVLLSVGMAVTMAGIIIAMAYVWRVWECPVCGIKLWSGGVGTLGGKCLGCQTQLYIPRRSKGGRLYP
jgi:hypothetical protein